MTDGGRPRYTARPGEALHVCRTEDGNFEIGSGRVTVVTDDIVYLQPLLMELGRLAYIPEGEDALRRGDQIGKPILITKPGRTEPSNAWEIPEDLAAAQRDGIGCGSTIAFDPRDWPLKGDPRSPTAASVLLLLLRQANANAAGESVPTEPDWVGC